MLVLVGADRSVGSREHHVATQAAGSEGGSGRKGERTAGIDIHEVPIVPCLIAPRDTEA